MKAKHHFWSSLAVGGALYWATGSGAALVGSMVGGFLIDSDHVIDQLWSIRHGAPFKKEQKSGEGAVDSAATGPPRRWNALVRPRKLVRLPLGFTHTNCLR